jgi:hypothetical protein
VLPTEFGDGTREVLEAAGVVFGSTVEGDPMFRYATLPPGWEKRRTDHSMWTELRDERGRKRASIFYKAAFYDRSAHMSAARRYAATLDYSEEAYRRQREQREFVGIVTDCGEIIQRFVFASGSDDLEYGPTSAAHKAEKAATAWLDEHRPDWRDPGA